MTWSLAVHFLFLQIKTQGNQKGKKLHLVPARLPGEGEAQPASAERAGVGGHGCVFTSHVEMRKQSPEVNGPLSRDSVISVGHYCVRIRMTGPG